MTARRAARALLAAVPAAGAALAAAWLHAATARETLFRGDAAGIALFVVLAAFSSGSTRAVATRLLLAAALLGAAHAAVAATLGLPAGGALALVPLVLGVGGAAAGLAALGRAFACPPAAASAVGAAVLLTACGGLWWADRFAERLPLEARPAARQAVLTLDPLTAAAYGCCDLDRLHLPDVYDQTTIATLAVAPPTPLETAAWWGGVGLLAAAAATVLRPRTPRASSRTPVPVARATALVVGAGGIGCPCAWALVDAGVSRVVIVDFDVVEPSNLPRQVLFGPGDVGRPKAVVAAERLGGAARGVEAVVARFDAANGTRLLAACDVAVDATDGAATKDFVHAAAVRAGVPFVHAAALGAEGRVLDVPAGGRPCLSCVFGALSEAEAGDTCASFGVWPGVTGAVGALAAAAALARLEAPSAPPRGLRVLDLDGPRAVTLAVATDPACPVCGEAARSGAAPAAPRAAVVRAAAPAPVAVPTGALDLTQESCPMNMLRARRAVDALAPGGRLEIWLGDDGRESVPEGLAALGYEVLERAEAGDALRLVVRRRTGAPS